MALKRYDQLRGEGVRVGRHQAGFRHRLVWVQLAHWPNNLTSNARSQGSKTTCASIASMEMRNIIWVDERRNRNWKVQMFFDYRRHTWISPFTRQTLCLRTTICLSSGCIDCSSFLTDSILTLCSADSWTAKTSPVALTCLPKTTRESPTLAT